VCDPLKSSTAFVTRLVRVNRNVVKHTHIALADTNLRTNIAYHNKKRKKEKKHRCFYKFKCNPKTQKSSK